MELDRKQVDRILEKLDTQGVSRRSFLRHVATAAAIATAGPLLAGCGSGTSGTTAGQVATTAAMTPTSGGSGVVLAKGLPIVTLYSSLSIEYYQMWKLGAEQAVKALEMNYVELANELKPETEISQFESQVQSGAQMFFITSPDPGNIPDIAAKANSDKAYLINVWEEPDWVTPFNFGDYYVQYRSPDSIGQAYTMAKMLFDKMGGKGGLLHITGWPGGTPDWQRTAGVDKALKEYPDIKLLDRKPGKWNPIDSRKAMEDMITAYPDFGGVFAQNDDCAIGALQALEERGIDVPIVGLDGNKQMIQYMTEKKVFASMSHFPWWVAGNSAVSVYDAFNGWKPSAPERMMFYGGLPVTQDNAQSYMDKFYGGSDLPFDWPLMSRMIHPDDWDPQNEMWPMEQEKMWEGRPKPDGWVSPQAIEDAKAAAEYDKVKQLYADHYKKKITL